MLRDTISSGKGKVLAIVTSHDLLGDTGYRTGYWMPELAYPYLALVRAGYDIDVASPMGGNAPVDPYSDPSSRPCRPPIPLCALGYSRTKLTGENSRIR